MGQRPYRYAFVALGAIATLALGTTAQAAGPAANRPPRPGTLSPADIARLSAQANQRSVILFRNRAGRSSRRALCLPQTSNIVSGREWRPQSQ